MFINWFCAKIKISHRDYLCVLTAISVIAPPKSPNRLMTFSQFNNWQKSKSGEGDPALNHPRRRSTDAMPSIDMHTAHGLENMS